MFGSGGRALARPALVAITIGLVALASLGGGRGGRSLAQEGEATPVAVDFGQLVGERPAEIVSGSCAEPGEPVAQLTALEIPEGEAQGQGAAIEAERSYTSLPLDLQALLDGPYSVSILLSDEESDLAIACGEIGGVPSDGGAIVVKLSPRNDSGFSGIAFLAPEGAGATGASLFVAGERTVGETRELIAATPGAALEALTPIPEPTPTAEPVQVVDVALTEWLIDMPEEIRAGQINFAITNEGTEAHAFVVESGGVTVAELPRPLEPGASAVLSTPLFEGTYLVYCPVGEGEHRAEGMEAELLVTP